MNIANLGVEHIKRHGEYVTAHFEGRDITNVEVHRRACQLGNALLGLGIGENQTVAVIMSNCPEVFESFSAIFAIGAVVLPILFVLTAEECRFILEDSGTVAVITDTTQEHKILEAAESLDSIKHIIVVGGRDTDRTLSYENLLEKASSKLEIVDKNPDDLAMLMYTAGTTAQPKGVMLTHQNLLEAAKSSYYANEVTRPFTGLLCLPLAHIYGVGALNSSNLSEFKGSDGVLMRWFDPEECFRLIEKYKVYFLPAVPTMFALLLYHPAADRYDLSSLGDCISGGAPLSKELHDQFESKFNCRMRQLYGLTEAAGMGAIIRPSHPYREGTVGKAYDNVTLAIFDDDDNPLPPGELGEVVIQGPQVMKGYLNRPEETAEVLRGGWLHTGDIGYLDDEGFLYITDRKKDLIIKGGENIMPVQIEEVLYKHAAVMEAAAIGVPDPVYGEEIVACVALKPGMQVPAEEILDFARKQLPTFKQPREVIILETLPKSSIGKILKRELRRKYTQSE